LMLFREPRTGNSGEDESGVTGVQELQNPGGSLI
jgi:hypothetical protein